MQPRWRRRRCRFKKINTYLELACCSNLLFQQAVGAEEVAIGAVGDDENDGDPRLVSVFYIVASLRPRVRPRLLYLATTLKGSRTVTRSF